MDYHTEEEYANVEKEGVVSAPMIKINPIDISYTNPTVQVLASSSSSSSSSSSLSRPLSSNTYRLKLLTEIKSAHKTLNFIDKTEERVRDASLSASWFQTTTPSMATTTTTRASASVPMDPFQSTTTDSFSSETSVSIFNPMISSNMTSSASSSSSTTLPLQQKKFFESFISSRELMKRK
jgi:hypothetical protein